jgi:hypothetical protein
MTKGQATKLAAKLVDAGVLIRGKPLSKYRSKGERSIHGPSGIDGVWARTATRNAPERNMRLTCDDVAAALLGSGRWSVKAIRSCRHTYNFTRGD